MVSGIAKFSEFNYKHVTQGNENSAKNVDLMGHSLQPFLAYGFLHHLCLSDFKNTVFATNFFRAFRRSCVDFLKNFFEDELHATQSIFSSKEKYEKILGMITDEGMKEC